MRVVSLIYLQLGKRRGKIMTLNLMLNHLRNMGLVGILQLLRELKENGGPMGRNMSHSRTRGEMFWWQFAWRRVLKLWTETPSLVEIGEMDDLQVERSRKTPDFLDKWKAGLGSYNFRTSTRIS